MARFPDEVSDEQSYRRYVLGHLRMARKRAEMLIVEIDAIGKALKADWITPDNALLWLRADALCLVQSEPFDTIRSEAETVNEAEQEIIP